MYEVANATVRSGLSRGARVLLGTVAGLFGALMLTMAPSGSSPIGFAVFGSFCIAIALSCATWGRVRQFIGSLIGTALFAMSIWYFYSQLVGTPVLWRRSEPSLLNAALFFVFFGLPGAAYVYSAKFGLAKREP